MARADEEVKRKESGQLDMFASFSGEPQKVELIGSEEEFTDSEIQMAEKELLGFYVTSHPLSIIEKHLPFLTTHSISELSELKDGDPITVCGLLTMVRSLMTKEKVDKKGNVKPGSPYKVGTIEDLSGSIDFILFTKNMEKYSQFLQPESKVILAGRLNKTEDEENSSVKIFVDSVRPVENTNILNLHLKKEMKYEDIVELREVFVQHKGDDPIIIHVGGARILANPALWVNVNNELINQLKNYWGEVLDVSAQSLDSE